MSKVSGALTPVLTPVLNPILSPVLGGKTGRPSWLLHDAIWAANFELGQYWRRRGGILPATSVLATTRASGINLPNTAGEYQSLGINTLPRTDRGLYANEQVTNLRTYSQDISNAAWDKLAGSAASAVLFNEDGANAQHGVEGLLVVSAGVHTFSFDIEYKGRQWIRVDPYNIASPGTDAIWFDILNGVKGAQQANATGAITPYGNGRFRISWTATLGAGNLNISVRGASADNSTANYVGLNGPAFEITNLQVQTGALSFPPVPTTTAASTLLASDIRAVQGTRPDTNPEPFPGWEAAGLDGAFGGNAIVTIDRLNAATARFIAGAGVDANNITKLIFDTDNRFKLIVRKSGVDEVTLQTGAVASTGDKTIEWQAKPGDYGIDATGVAGDTDSDAETLPTGATTLRVGSDFGALNPFNGWIKELQILKVTA